MQCEYQCDAAMRAVAGGHQNHGTGRECEEAPPAPTVASKAVRSTWARAQRIVLNIEGVFRIEFESSKKNMFGITVHAFSMQSWFRNPMLCFSEHDFECPNPNRDSDFCRASLRGRLRRSRSAGSPQGGSPGREVQGRAPIEGGDPTLGEIRTRHPFPLCGSAPRPTQPPIPVRVTEGSRGRRLALRARRIRRRSQRRSRQGRALGGAPSPKATHGLALPARSGCRHMRSDPML